MVECRTVLDDTKIDQENQATDVWYDSGCGPIGSVKIFFK